MANAEADRMQVEVVICMAAGEVRRVALSLAAGRLVRDALLGSGLLASAIIRAGPISVTAPHPMAL